MIVIKQHKTDCEKVLEFVNEELQGLRTGRANAALIEGIMVDSYGTLTPLKQVGSISVPDARTLLVSPWDKSILKDIEKALANSGLGINPVNDGVTLRLPFPPLTEESRKQIVKVVGQKCEGGKVSLRSIRDTIKDQILKAEKEKELTQDDRYALVEELDEMIRDYTRKIEEIGKEKEDEIMSI